MHRLVVIRWLKSFKVTALVRGRVESLEDPSVCDTVHSVWSGGIEFPRSISQIVCDLLTLKEKSETTNLEPSPPHHHSIVSNIAYRSEFHTCILEIQKSLSSTLIRWGNRCASNRLWMDESSYSDCRSRTANAFFVAPIDFNQHTSLNESSKIESRTSVIE